MGEVMDMIEPGLRRALVRPGESKRAARSIVVSCIFLAVWLGLVVFTTTKHEFWRDEVRALSLASAARSPLDLYELTKYEGHPVLWFLVLHVARTIVDTRLVLPIASVAIGFAAATLFVMCSPFSLLIRILFTLGFPLYEYSVMARNYGISMLLLFVSAMLWQSRDEHPVRLGVALALLANTNVHSTILVCVLTAAWIWNAWSRERVGGGLYPALGVVLSGLVLCAVFTVPKEGTIVTSIRHTASVPLLTGAVVDAVRAPGQSFDLIVPARLPAWVGSVLLYLAVAGLARRPELMLAAFVGQAGLGALFHVIARGQYRHQGVFLVFLVILYWIDLETPRDGILHKGGRQLFTAGLSAIVILLLWNANVAARSAWADLRFERSSSQSLGAFLTASETYERAIIVPEPDFLLESLPYYAANRIYFPREHRFGTTVSWTTKASARLSLGELLAAARDVKGRYDMPVLIVLGHLDMGESRTGEKAYSYNKIFTWNAAESADFAASTTRVAEFMAAHGSENYLVYALR
jgi:hypothetical protein